MQSFTQSNIELHKLNSQDQEKVSELISAFATCRDESTLTGLMQRLSKIISFKHWALVTIKLANEWEMTKDHFFISNYPQTYLEDYVSLQLEFVDFVMLKCFQKENFGKLQLWADTYKEVEEQRGQIDPVLYKKHHEFLRYVKEWGILQEGYSLGKHSFIKDQNCHYGSIFTIADGITPEGRTETILNALMPYLNTTIINMWLAASESEK